MKNLWTFLITNWKTTLSGFLFLIVAVLLKSGTITPEISTIILSVLGFLGFSAAKDADKTGV
jgi:hypothetical protein